MKFCALVLMPAMLAAATAHLYNLKTGEVLDVKYSRWSGKRKITTRLPNGTVLEGEFSTMTDGSAAWGSVYTSVMGRSATGSGSALSLRGIQHGAAVLVGGGEILDCEYVSSALNGHGTGGCRDKEGQLWRLMF